MNIEKNIPIPTSGGRTGRPAKYPFSKMDIGESVFFGGEKIGAQCKPYVAATVYGSKYGKKFTGRTVDGGVRIWRIA